MRCKDEGELPFTFSVMAKDAGRVHEILQKNEIAVNRFHNCEVKINQEVSFDSKINFRYKPRFNDKTPLDVILSDVYAICKSREKHKEFFTSEICSKETGIDVYRIKNILEKYF